MLQLATFWAKSNKHQEASYHHFTSPPQVLSDWKDRHSIKVGTSPYRIPWTLLLTWLIINKVLCLKGTFDSRYSEGCIKWNYQKYFLRGKNVVPWTHDIHIWIEHIEYFMIWNTWTHCRMMHRKCGTSIYQPIQSQASSEIWINCVNFIFLLGLVREDLILVSFVVNFL